MFNDQCHACGRSDGTDETSEGVFCKHCGADWFDDDHNEDDDINYGYEDDGNDGY